MVNRNQTGAALFVSLILLVVMTLLGITTAKMTIIGERMAGHFFNKQISFDSAEAALRDGEAAASAFELYAPTDGTGGLYLPDATATPLWDDSGTVWQARTGATLGGVAQQPRFVAEYLGGVPRDDNCLLDSDASSNQDCWRYVYRVSGQGWGANTNSSSLTQSTVHLRK